MYFPVKAHCCILPIFSFGSVPHRHLIKSSSLGHWWCRPYNSCHRTFSTFPYLFSGDPSYFGTCEVRDSEGPSKCPAMPSVTLCLASGSTTLGRRGFIHVRSEPIMGEASPSGQSSELSSPAWAFAGPWLLATTMPHPHGLWAVSCKRRNLKWVFHWKGF